MTTVLENPSASTHEPAWLHTRREEARPSSKSFQPQRTRRALALCPFPSASSVSTALRPLPRQTLPSSTHSLHAPTSLANAGQLVFADDTGTVRGHSEHSPPRASSTCRSRGHPAAPRLMEQYFLQESTELGSENSSACTRNSTKPARSSTSPRGSKSSPSSTTTGPWRPRRSSAHPHHR